MKTAARPREDFEAALGSDEPIDALRAAVRRMLGGDYDRQAIMSILEDFRESLRTAGREKDEELVLEVMTHLEGWASPHLVL